MSTVSSSSLPQSTTLRPTSPQQSNPEIFDSQEATSSAESSQLLDFQIAQTAQTAISPRASFVTTSSEPVSTANISRRATITTSPQLPPVTAQTPKLSPSRARRAREWTIILRAFGVRLLSTWRSTLYGQDTEVKKIILDQSFRVALIRCSVHFLPISASVALTVLNLKGYFIGATFQGPSNLSDAVDTLFLQVAAKMMELLIVASLSTIVLEIIRHEILHRKEGLPFGLLGSAFSFKDLSFFWSPNLWYGTGAISSKWQKGRILVILLVSGLVATFAGPSAALLMIPPARYFPGGGTTFWLVGNGNSLWPLNLNSGAVGGASCLNATAEMLELRTKNTTGCIWSSTSSIAESAKGWHLSTFYNTITIVDELSQRSVSYRASDWTANYFDTWAVSSSCAIAAYSTELSKIWYDAIYHAPITKHIAYSSLKYREPTLSLATTVSQIPVTRVRCNNRRNVTFGTSSELSFPVFAYYGDFPASEHNLSVTTVNSSSILTQWIPIPQTPRKRSFSSIYSYPSTFLTIQIPQNSENCTVYACALDARWADGEASLSNVAHSNSLQTGVVTSKNGGPYANPRFSPIDDGTWKQVNADLDWLYTLTPFLNSSVSPPPPQTRDLPGWTSLGSLLATAGFDNSTSLIQSDGGWASLTSALESVIAILVTEGMARIGLTENMRAEIYYKDAGIPYLYSGLTDTIYPFYDSILKDDSKCILPQQHMDADNLTKAHWDVLVSGYAYKANSIAYYLAIAVLLLHAAMALAHMAHCLLFKQLSSDAWDSFEEMMALSYNSRPEGKLRNASPGVRSNATLKKKVMIRVVEGEKRVRGEEEVQLLFDRAPDEGFEMVKFNEEYGAVD